MEGVVSVFRRKKLQLQTTASWDFMGLKEGNNTKRNPAVESDTIIGLMDTGVWPESESFSDKGFGPPPKKWKGVCKGGKNFTCNNKVIGARDYEGEGARDLDGHGSHTSSIVAGNAVAGASFFGIGNGTARGGVPAARIAVYKVCDSTGCNSDAVLSAFDDAIADGVDLISISIGGEAIRYEEDTTAIGAFHAMAKGILTVNAAGNEGPNPNSVSSVAPWILTVAASTTNREFLTKVIIQNGKTLVGRSVNAFDLQGKNYPLVYAGSKVKGKILVSRELVSSDVAVATIIKDTRNLAIVSPRPLSALSPDDFDFLVSYVNSTKSTQGTVLKTEAVFNQKAPKIAYFSSRGPNTIAVDLLKPDITAPGVEILAAYSPLGSPSSEDIIDRRHVKYTVISGTSMSCPHVAGVAAYIRTFHPDWSPAVIQSAIMTTAWSMNASDTGVASTEFAYGAGHVDPIAALNPGLVYELDKADHITFLCGLNYTSKALKIITGEAVTCTGNTLPRNLNYPSMSAKLARSNSPFTVTFNRTVTNLGTPNSTYKSNIVLNHGTKLSVKITPNVLSMKSVKEKQSFTVTVSGSNIDPKLPSSANLIWSDEKLIVGQLHPISLERCLDHVIECSSSVLAVTDDPQDKQVYIVYMGSLPSGLEYSPMSHHMSILQEITGESSIDGRLVRSYKRSFNGFAARLSEPERERIAEMEGVVSVFRRKKLQLQTTASWDFMGLKEGNNTKRNPAVESDTIIGLMDTGVWPESESFSDKGFGPPPKKWKGVCKGGKNFTCNNCGASFFGIGNGTARGGVPAARIAVYKVCDSTGCNSDAVLSAFDDAIADGVDLISISIGGEAIRYEEDTTAIGAFHAMAKGILTVNSAGNEGPNPNSVSSVAPWILTVAASTTNREFLTKVIIQNGKTLVVRRSVNAFDLQGKNYPLVYAGSKPSSLSALSPDDFDFLVSYVNSTKSTQGTVLKTEAVFNQKAPKLLTSLLAVQTLSLLTFLRQRLIEMQPDITAPGVEILAAYSPLGSPSSEDIIDRRHVKYTVISGTSMSCPHVAGVAAYIRTFHPDWSPAVIQSAIMTTAWSMSASDTGVASTEFAYGAGHVDPIAALNPGLVYELDKADHITFLCGLNYTSKALKIITGEAVTCTGNTLPRNLNYPSMSAKLARSNSPFTVTFNRTVTNLGTPNSTYKSNIVLNHGTKLSVKITPNVLSMKSVKEKQSFTVTVSGSNIDPKLPSSANLIWSDEKLIVGQLHPISLERCLDHVIECSSSVLAVTDDPQDKQVYIVYMGSLPSGLEYSPMSHHMSILQEITGESSIDGRLVRSYKRSFNGFAARLSEPERERIAEMEGVVSVFRRKKLQLQTTASWDFMGLKEGNNTKRNPAVESDTIIGLMDTGVWPESESFSDKGFGPPPKKWKGVCKGGKNFTCNNKVIGARDYEGEGARDLDGHGSHTSSIVAGNAVAGASFFGIGNGTARGGVPAARIAVYKVCDSTGCNSDAVLSAFDDAIADGVDLISISIGGEAIRYEEDTTAIGAFHAMAKGILTVNAAGNEGPNPNSVSSVAPWILTVAASTTNREFLTKVIIQNGKTLVVRRSVNAFDLQGKNYPLVYAGSKVKGKILVSRELVSSDVAVATIIKDTRNLAIVSPRPLSALSPDDFDFLVSYVNSTKSTQGTVLKTEAVFNQKAPKIAYFSSRGPNTIAVDLLKPDITAPGVEILAAYSPLGSPSSEDIIDRRHVKYTVISGTSMSCPHVAGVAAYIRTFHPDWSPAVIQSAIMTTAWSMNASDTGVASTEFAYGAGHVDPIAALNPGLVYELDKADHITFLCGLNYTSKALKIITGEAVTCTGNTLPRNLNYPSMSAKLARSNSPFTVTFNRTVTNLGTPNSTYKSNIVLNHGTKLSVKITPNVLSMKSVKEKQSFTVTVSGSNIDPKLPSSANLIWSDGTHNVKSPIVVYIDGY
ncbi:hypothetical protein Bca101_025296 [Brassica carinata]